MNPTKITQDKLKLIIQLAERVISEAKLNWYFSLEVRLNVLTAEFQNKNKNSIIFFHAQHTF